MSASRGDHPFPLLAVQLDSMGFKVWSWKLTTTVRRSVPMYHATGAGEVEEGEREAVERFGGPDVEADVIGALRAWHAQPDRL